MFRNDATVSVALAALPAVSAAARAADAPTAGQETRIALPDGCLAMASPHGKPTLTDVGLGISWSDTVDTRPGTCRIARFTLPWEAD